MPSIEDDLQGVKRLKFQWSRMVKSLSIFCGAIPGIFRIDLPQVSGPDRGNGGRLD